MIVDEMDERMTKTVHTTSSFADPSSAKAASAASSTDDDSNAVPKAKSSKAKPICCNDIDTFFVTSTREENDGANSKRERIIERIQTFSDEFKTDPIYGEKWTKLYNAWTTTVADLVERSAVPPYTSMTIKRMAGRNHNYDFELVFDSGDIVTTRKVEFKFGATNISDLPQILSLYINILSMGEAPTYDMFFYDHYLDKYLACDEGITEQKPSREVYKSIIFKSKHTCHPFIEQLHERDNKKDSENIRNNDEIFHIVEKTEVVHESIRDYLETYATHLDIDQCNAIRNKTQQDKWYFLWKNDQFHIDQLDLSHEMTYLGLKNGNTIQLADQTGCYNFLLRWKNHNGILGPAWQIKYVRSESK